ncbi:CPBP family intramembrane glutamic endopeptidase [Bacillus marinisedimentorum]|uniref:CPBP family intramembrane glutamic endopeptidase n=1 Tax=Bacillus marinisedimentorum TaxID=1821260 RepID=UPI000873334B|nr:CPBP family intramembrane glutamic endopeptidase [Bacillus marinisedimentorum]
MKQAEIVKKLTPKELVFQVYVTQGLVLAAAAVIGFFLFDSLQEFTKLWSGDVQEVLVYGGIAGLAALLVDFFLMKTAPGEWYDDGGINEKIFANIPVAHIFFLTMLISFSEEILFRGVIQSNLGYYTASILFAVLHIRYLGKFLLFSVVTALSFFLGWLFMITGNLFVTVFAHFIIDFVMGAYIRFTYLKSMDE